MSTVCSLDWRVHFEHIVFQILHHVRKGGAGKVSKQKKGRLGRYQNIFNVCAIISFVSSHFGTQCFHSFLHTRNDDAAASSTDQKENANKQSNLVSVVFCEVIEYM